jgi:hypothetical protein
MSTLANDHLRRLEHLLATARADYDTLAYIMLEGVTQLQVLSLKREVLLPISGEDIGHLNTLLGEAALNRITDLEKQLVEAHHQVVVEADEQQTEEQALTTYRDQERAGKVGASAGAILPAHATSPNQDADSIG